MFLNTIEFFFLFSYQTEKIKLAICTEIKSWIVTYGRNANTKYRNSMVQFFKFIDTFSKRFSRPINDLDDVRFAMATLKELRNEEIKLDMEVAPIEVNILPKKCLFKGFL